MVVFIVFVEINDDFGSCLVNIFYEIDLMILFRYNWLVDIDWVDLCNLVSFMVLEVFESCMIVGCDVYFGDWFGVWFVFVREYFNCRG